MIIKLPIINNNKVVYTLFKLEKIDNYLLLSILENSNISNDNFFNCDLLSSELNKTIEIPGESEERVYSPDLRNANRHRLDKLKSPDEISFIKILTCNNINGISYLNIFFPLKLFIIDSNIFCIYFFMINLTSNFRNKLDFFYNLNEILIKKFNFRIIEFNNLLKYENNIFEIINNEYKDFIVNKKFNKEFWEMINILLNLSIFILWANNIKTNCNASEVTLFSGAQAKENTQTNRNASEDVKLFSGAQAKENTPIENNSEEVINNEVWLIKSGFRRAFHFHNVFCNKETNEYAFHVSDGDLYNQRYDDFPNFGRYPNYYDMLDGVVEKYAKLWKIE